MILTPHLLLGSAITLTIPFLPLAVALAFLSHYILDALPHWEYSTRNLQQKNWSKAIFDFLKIGADFSCGILILIIVLLNQNLLLGLIGAFFAALPDIGTFVYILFPKNRLLTIHYHFHSACHWHKEKSPIFFQVVTELVIIILSIWLL